MKYVDYGQTGLRVSRFGLGCMRFPRDTKEAVKMVRYALDNGVNYLDTAYVYQNSETVMGLALENGYRNKAILATKNPVWEITRHSDFEKLLDEQLLRLKTNHIDIYLLHNLGYANWLKVKQYDGFTFLDKMLKKGKILHKAFSFHGTVSGFKEIVDAYDWEMAQIQLNILDEFQQAGVEGLKYASHKGMAVVIMEPLRGGHILDNAPEEVKGLLDSYPEKRSLLEWCFRWLYNMPEVTTVISGTSSVEQLRKNIKIFDNSDRNVMFNEDLAFINQIRDIFESKGSIGCSGCKYCMPCPKNVDIPGIFKLYNNYSIMKSHWIDKEMYKSDIVPSGTGADKCVSCGLCVKRCPQGLSIPEKLKEVHKEFAG